MEKEIASKRSPVCTLESIAEDNDFFKRMLALLPPHILSQDQHNQGTHTSEEDNGKTLRLKKNWNLLEVQVRKWYY